MKLCTFRTHEGEIKLGCETPNGQIVEIPAYDDMTAFIIDYPHVKQRIQDSMANAKRYTRADVQLLAPVQQPGKMIFVGLNYRNHAEESKLPIPEKPVLFAKFANSLAGDQETITIPAVTKQCDYEAELAVVIGKKARRVTEQEALASVFGYTACNDLSARDLQLTEGGQWTRGKAIDCFAPMGPYLVTSDELKDPHHLHISCKVNGQLRQNENTSQLIFSIPYLISHLSKTITLMPGDVISTGTPAGVAAAMNPPDWLKEGDVVEVSIEGIGVLTNIFSEEGGGG